MNKFNKKMLYYYNIGNKAHLNNKSIFQPILTCYLNVPNMKYGDDLFEVM